MPLVGQTQGFDQAGGDGLKLQATSVREIYCPRCRSVRPGPEWKRIFRHVRRGAQEGCPAEVLRHQACDEIVYLLIE